MPSPVQATAGDVPPSDPPCDCPSCNGSGIEGGFTPDKLRGQAVLCCRWPLEGYNGSGSKSAGSRATMQRTLAELKSLGNRVWEDALDACERAVQLRLDNMRVREELRRTIDELVDNS